jgi:hypothetical protein
LEDCKYAGAIKVYQEDLNLDPSSPDRLDKTEQAKKIQAAEEKIWHGGEFDGNQKALHHWPPAARPSDSQSAHPSSVTSSWQCIPCSEKVGLWQERQPPYGHPLRVEGAGYVGVTAQDVSREFVAVCIGNDAIRSYCGVKGSQVWGGESARAIRIDGVVAAHKAVGVPRFRTPIGDDIQFAACKASSSVKRLA